MVGDLALKLEQGCLSEPRSLAEPSNNVRGSVLRECFNVDRAMNGS